MAPRVQCEFSLLRYVPDPVRCEFVNIGVMVQVQAESGAKRVAGLKLTADWRRARCLDPDVDTEMLEALEVDLKQSLLADSETAAKENLMQVLEDSCSNCVQLSESRGYLIESLETGIGELMRLYVEPHQQKRASRVSGRTAIQNAMRGEFERVGVWDLLRKRIPVAQYTRPGDPLRLDCGYRGDSNGSDVLRIFHAVSLEHVGNAGGGMSLEMAKVLAFSASSLRAGVERLERATLELAAVVEPWPKFVAHYAQDEDREGAYRFAVETMEENAVRVCTTADLTAVAETARLALRV